MKIDRRTAQQLKKSLIAQLKEKKKNTIVITSAYTLSEAEIDMIVEGVKNSADKQIINIVDPTLLGGFTLQDESGLLDLSVAGSLHNLASYQ